MTIYKPKATDNKSKKVVKQEVSNFDDENYDNPFVQDDTVRIVNNTRSDSNQRQGRFAILRCLIVLITSLIIVVSVFGIVFLYVYGARNDKIKPWIETCRVHYYQWKTGASGKNKAFLMEGDFYQQVEIDTISERYEKLNIPPILNTMRSIVMHDMDQGLTVFIDQDHGRCFITPINATMVKPISDFYNLVQSNKAGYYLPDAELVYDNYRILKPEIEDVSKFGRKIYDECQFYETYRIERDDLTIGEERNTPCMFQGQQYCMGNAGSKYMPIFVMSRCVV